MGALVMGRFYYGWVNVVVASIAMSATLPGRTYGLGLIKVPLCADLELDDLRFAWLNSAAIILGAVVVLPIGRLIDRIGARMVLTLVAAGLGICVIAMSRAWDETSLFVTMTLVRGLGQGALSVVAIALVGKWFKRRVGPAMGVFTVLLAVGFALPILVVGEAVRSEGWRAAWAGVGSVLLFGLAPFGWLVARSSPESFGVSPDDPVEEGLPFASFTLAEALRTPAFWVFTCAATLFNFVFSALTLDNELLLTEHGLDGRSVNETVLGVLMVSGLPANIVAGLLARRVAMGKLLSVGVAILAGAVFVFPSVRSIGGAMGYAAILGVSGGIITVAYFAIYGQYYGREHLGAIQGAVQVLGVVASAGGPVVLAVVRENFEITDAFFFGSAAAAVFLAGLCWRVKPPVRLEIAGGN